MKIRVSFIIFHSPFKAFHKENANIITIKMKFSSRAAAFHISEWRCVELVALVEVMNSAFSIPCRYSFTLAAILKAFYQKSCYIEKFILPAYSEMPIDFSNYVSDSITFCTIYRIMRKVLKIIGICRLWLEKAIFLEVKESIYSLHWTLSWFLFSLHTPYWCCSKHHFAGKVHRMAKGWGQIQLLLNLTWFGLWLRWAFPFRVWYNSFFSQPYP